MLIDGPGSGTSHGDHLNISNSNGNLRGVSSSEQELLKVTVTIDNLISGGYAISHLQMFIQHSISVYTNSSSAVTSQHDCIIARLEQCVVKTVFIKICKLFK